MNPAVKTRLEEFEKAIHASSGPDRTGARLRDKAVSSSTHRAEAPAKAN
jgi:hypothetical protein